MNEPVELPELPELPELLERLELELLQPQVRANATRLDVLIAGDFVEVAGSGRTFGKSEVLSRLPLEAGIQFVTFDMQSWLLSPTVGLVTYVAQRDCEGVKVTSRRSSVWVLAGDGWQMRYHQGTLSETDAR